jgi:hypothetical protein
VMRRKLIRRAQLQKTHLSLKDLEESERRAGSAYGELKEAHHFEYVIPNHDGEDSDNWEAFYYPLGDAVVALLRGEDPKGVERWEEDCPLGKAQRRSRFVPIPTGLVREVIGRRYTEFFRFSEAC